MTQLDGKRVGSVPRRVGDSSKVVIAVVDDGFNLQHPALERRTATNLPLEAVFRPSRADSPFCSHGTHVAAIAAGNDIDGVFSGVAPGSVLLPVDVRLSEDHPGDRVRAINYLADLAAQTGYRIIVNLSWEFAALDEVVRNELHEAIGLVDQAGAMVIAAAGNIQVATDLWPRYPAHFEEVLTVAATDALDQLAPFSAYGGAIDVCAPGVGIYSAWGAGYARKDGTSQASAHVSGVCALVWAKNPTLDSHRVREIILQSCDPIDDLNPEFRGQLGAGRVNAQRALAATPTAN